jgi:hypothetical protein
MANRYDRSPSWLADKAEAWDGGLKASITMVDFAAVQRDRDA